MHEKEKVIALVNTNILKNKHLSEKLVYIPLAGIEPTSPCILYSQEC